MSRNGRVVFEHAYGMANLETGTPIRPASIFHVASVSKQFTATAVMLLAKDGKLSVDDNIRKYLPEIPGYGMPITIRHLLTHTSGLRDQWNLIELARGGFEEYRITEADVMDILPRQHALNFTPGAEYLYSNSGFTLLGVIVKRVSGKSLRYFAEERIFKGTPFRPVFLDGFYEGGTLVQFTRSGGKVTGFEVTPGGLGG